MTNARTPPPKHLVLLGSGHAHVHMLSTLAKRPLPGVRITLVTPYPRQLYSGMVPGFLAGHYALDDCAIALEPLLKNTGVHWLAHSATGLDANTRTVTLDDGSTLHFDWLSVNTGPVQNRQQLEEIMPGVREYGLFVRPLETFGALWPRVIELAHSRALRIAVIGGGAAGIELATAIKFRLPTSSVTLLVGDANTVADYAPVVQKRVIKALQRRNITVLEEQAVGIQKDEIMLASGARLASDVPVIATGNQAPAWLENSGLALDPDGFIAVDSCQRSASHPHIFAAGDVSSRVDQPLARHGVQAVRSGHALANNLFAVVAGAEPRPQMPPAYALHLLSCGDYFAIACWGKFSAQGRWVWWLRDWMDRSFMKRYRRAR